MPLWIYYSLLVIVLWGVVGLLQKLGANRISSRSLVIWLTAGYVVLVPVLWTAGILALAPRDILLGVLSGFTNGLGAWYLFASLEAGAKASIAVPLTALYPLVTVALAIVILAERLTPLQWIGVTTAIVAGAMDSYETGEPQKGP